MSTQDPRARDPGPQDLGPQDPGPQDSGPRTRDPRSRTQDLRPKTSRSTTQDNTDGCAWFVGKGFFILVDVTCTISQSLSSVICKDFLHWFGWLALHCFLETRLIYSSILETKEVQLLTWKQAQLTCICFPVSFIILMKSHSYLIIRSA